MLLMLCYWYKYLKFTRYLLCNNFYGIDPCLMIPWNHCLEFFLDDMCFQEKQFHTQSFKIYVKHILIFFNVPEFLHLCGLCHLKWCGPMIFNYLFLWWCFTFSLVFLLRLMWCCSAVITDHVPVAFGPCNLFVIVTTCIHQLNLYTINTLIQSVLLSCVNFSLVKSIPWVDVLWVVGFVL